MKKKQNVTGFVSFISNAAIANFEQVISCWDA